MLRSIITISVLLLVGLWGAGSVAEANLLAVGHGVVHVWSITPGEDVVVVDHPAWGYRFHPRFAVVDCDVDPEEALVLLDGELQGEADDFDGFPSYLYVRPGQHMLEFRAEGRQPLVVRGSFRPGAFVRVDREMEYGAETETVALGEPDHFTGLEQPAYSPPVLPPDDGPAGPVEQQVTVPPDVDKTGFLRLQVSPADAAVYIDDRFFGSGDEISRLHGFIRLSAGPHSIQVTRPGYQDRSLPVEIICGEKQHLDVYLEKEIIPQG